MNVQLYSHVYCSRNVLTSQAFLLVDDFVVYDRGVKLAEFNPVLPHLPQDWKENTAACHTATPHKQRIFAVRSKENRKPLWVWLDVERTLFLSLSAAEDFSDLESKANPQWFPLKNR